MTGTLAVPALASAQNCTTDARQVVSAIYRQVLERNPNSTEATTWVNQLSGGQATVRELVQSIASSPEHRQRFLPGESEGSRRQAVTNLYKHILGREPDAGGLQAHLEGAGRDIDIVISSMISSPEYQQKYGEQAVPGQGIRYCGYQYNSSANNSSFRFRGMDRNNNGVIERSEWNGSNQSFNVHDWNRDGVLSNAEVRSGARRWPNDEGDFDPNGPATWTPWAFRRIDRNRDGRIVPNEWYYGPEAFRRADRDRNGALSPTEFENNAQFDDDRDDRFEYLDMNNNGRIESREWHGSVEAFQWLDRNNDNVLSRAEVVGDGSTQFDSFGSIDTNGNGRVEF
ncbi:MAG TPA: phycobilisome rod-core linker polypeptide, partial [Vicinamibacterales bacterium]|nr:phycobilisome rod-core linker polypeptide [Vicinamibacterales bacterium]